MLRAPAFRSALLVMAAVFLVGCGGDAGDRKSGGGSQAKGGGKGSNNATSTAKASNDSPAFNLGDLLEPFNIPTLEEVDATADWVDRPVRDALDVMRELKSKEPAPELTAEQALKLKNDSKEANEKLLAALGKLAPEDDAGVDFDSSVVVLTNGDLKSTHPFLTSSVAESEYHSLTAISLVTYDRNFDWFAVSDVVKSWQTSEDRLVDKFVLRDDLFWSDGKPVTAHDIEFSFKALMTDAVIVPALRTGPNELKAVKAYDDRTLVIFHKEVLPTRTENMQFYVLPSHLYAKTIPEDPSLAKSKAHTRLEDNPVVAGPYELVSRKRGEEYVLRRRESYYMHEGKQVRAKPYIKQVRMKAIEDLNTALLATKNGEIEVMELRAEHWVTQTSGPDFYKHNTKTTDTQWTEFHFVWNTQSPLFADKRVRWAMTYAVDYDELLNTICYGLYEQGRGVFHPTSWMFPKEPPELVQQDLDKAQDLLSEAGWEDTDGDGIVDKEINGQRVPFEFTMLTHTTDTGIKAATLMKECLDQVGVVCNVKPTEFTVIVQKTRDKEFAAALGGWGAGTDPMTNENLFGTGKARNYGSYSNPEVDRLFGEGKREFDREKRAAIYGEIHTRIWDDQPYTWLFYRNGFYAFNKKLRGHNHSPRGPFSYSPGFGSVYVPSAAP